MSTTTASSLPVIIGAALASGAQSTSEGARSPSDPIDLMAEALRLAADDAGGHAVLAQLGLTAVVGGLWRFPNPAATVARRLGINSGRTMLTDFGGQVPMQLFADIADRIQRGDVDVAVILGGECNASRRALTRSGQASSKLSARRPIWSRTRCNEYSPPIPAPTIATSSSKPFRCLVLESYSLCTPIGHVG